MEANSREGNEDEVWMERLEGSALGSAEQSDVETNLLILNLHLRKKER